MQRLFLLVVVGSVAAAGCAIPLVNTRLEPVPAAGHGTPALKAQVRKVGLTAGLLANSASLDTDSRLAVEIDVYNADRQRPLTVYAPRLVLRDALGGPEITGRPVDAGAGGIPPTIATGDDMKEPPPVTLGPGEGRTVWVVYGGFPADGPRAPVRAAVHLQADNGDAPLEIAIAHPVPGGPRWKLDASTISFTVGGAVSAFQTGTQSGSSDVALAPISLELLGSRARLFWGFGWRYEFLYREAVASGPVAQGPSIAVSMGFLPWRFPIGCYGQAAMSWMGETPPDAYRQVTNDGDGHTLFLPRITAGVIYSMGPRLASPGPFPIERPMSSLRRFQIRIGYAQWFRLGSAGGAGALELGLVGLIGP